MSGRRGSHESGAIDAEQYLGRTAEVFDAVGIAGRERALAQVLAEAREDDAAWRMIVGCQSDPLRLLSNLGVRHAT
jgi:hypothetical protein